MTTYRITLQYIGTRYAGWQIQKDRQTIQGCLVDALRQMTGETVSVVGSGRTDSGVHAMRQSAHFRLPRAISTAKLKPALNGILPWDIRVLRVERANANFHAQRHALKKRYEYRIYNGRVLSPFLCGYVHHVTAPLDLEAMRESAQYLRGSHDFSSFAAASTKVRSRTRTVFLSRILHRGRHIRYQVEADGFLHHMVRNLVGTLLEIGLHRMKSSDLVGILESEDRRKAGPTAPPHGLYLMRVFYTTDSTESDN